jgi:hypothetical protein
MGTTFTPGLKVVASDDHTIGKVVGEQADCVLVETGHVFKSTHAIPRSFLHEGDGEVRATVAKEIVDASPKIEGDDWDCDAVLAHYGISMPFEVDPDPEGPGEAGGGDPRAYGRPAVHGRLPNAYDPTGTTANES